VLRRGVVQDQFLPSALLTTTHPEVKWNFIVVVKLVMVLNMTLK
jgi:hypothetical protein